MRLDQTLRDGKTEPDTAWALTGARQPNERFEDSFRIASRDSRPVIADRESYVAVLAPNADADLRSRGRELRRVLDQVRQDLLYLDVVELDRRKIVRHVKPHRVARSDRSHPARDVLDERTDVVPCLARHERSVLDA